MTIREIAQMAGVSTAAVSRYLNSGSLSEEKRRAIRAVIEQTGYKPDTAAQTLRTGRVNQIGVIVPKLHSDSVSQVAGGCSASWLNNRSSKTTEKTTINNRATSAGAKK